MCAAGLRAQRQRRPSASAATAARLQGSRRPPLGAVLRHVPARHEQELDALGSELEELRMHARAVEPRLQQEVQESRARRRELSQSRREVRLCERALELQAKERAKQEARHSDEVGFLVQLETKAEELWRECPTAQRLFRVESQSEELQAERQRLLLDLRALEASHRHNEERARGLVLAVSQRAGGLGLPEADGGAVLYGIADARDTAAEGRLEGEAARGEVAVLSTAVGLLGEELSAVRIAVEEDEEQIARLQAEVAVERSSHGALAAEAAALRRGAGAVLGAVGALSEEIWGRRRELDASRSAGSALEQQEEELALSLKEAGQALAELRQRAAARQPPQDPRLAALIGELSASVRQQEEQDLALDNLEAIIVALQSRTICAELEVQEADSSCRELRRFTEGESAQKSRELERLSQQRQRLAALRAQRRRLRDRCALLGSGLAEERRAAEALRGRAAQLAEEHRQAAETARAAARRCKQVLDGIAAEDSMLREREGDLVAEQVTREELQETLASSVSEASQDLLRLQREEGAVLKEATALRRSNTTLRSLVSPTLDLDDVELEG